MPEKDQSWGMIADDRIMPVYNRFEKIKASDNRIMEDYDCQKKIKVGIDDM